MVTTILKCHGTKSLTAHTQTAQLWLSVISCLPILSLQLCQWKWYVCRGLVQKALLSYLLKRFLQIDLNCQVHSSAFSALPVCPDFPWTWMHKKQEQYVQTENAISWNITLSPDTHIEICILPLPGKSIPRLCPEVQFHPLSSREKHFSSRHSYHAF